MSPNATDRIQHHVCNRLPSFLLFYSYHSMTPTSYTGWLELYQAPILRHFQFSSIPFTVPSIHQKSFQWNASSIFNLFLMPLSTWYHHLHIGLPHITFIRYTVYGIRLTGIWYGPWRSPSDRHGMRLPEGRTHSLRWVTCGDVMHCTPLQWTVMYCTVLYCTVLYCTVLYCTVLYCTAMNWAVLHCTALYWTMLCYGLLKSHGLRLLP